MPSRLAHVTPPHREVRLAVGEIGDEDAGTVKVLSKSAGHLSQRVRVKAVPQRIGTGVGLVSSGERLGDVLLLRLHDRRVILARGRLEGELRRRKDLTKASGPLRAVVREGAQVPAATKPRDLDDAGSPLLPCDDPNLSFSDVLLVGYCNAHLSQSVNHAGKLRTGISLSIHPARGGITVDEVAPPDVLVGPIALHDV